MEKYLRIGIITTTHGVHGEVKVYPTTDDMTKFERISEVIAVRTDADGNPEEVEDIRIPHDQTSEEGKSFSSQKNKSRADVSSHESMNRAKKKQSQRTLKIRSVKYFKNQVILGFEGIDTPEDVSKLRRYSLMIPREESGELKKDEYFISDLIGMEVYTASDKSQATVPDTDYDIASFTRYGQLTEVYQTAANDVYEITRDSDHKKILVPAIHDCILKVDVQRSRIYIHLLPGLEDI